jgi:hypothetical protein
MASVGVRRNYSGVGLHNPVHCFMLAASAIVYLTPHSSRSNSNDECALPERSSFGLLQHHSLRAAASPITVPPGSNIERRCPDCSGHYNLAVGVTYISYPAPSTLACTSGKISAASS